MPTGWWRDQKVVLLVLAANGPHEAMVVPLVVPLVVPSLCLVPGPELVSQCLGKRGGAPCGPSFFGTDFKLSHPNTIT